MKAKLVLILFSLFTLSTATLSARTVAEDDNAQFAAFVVPASGLESAQVTSIINIPSAVPRGPKELLQDYEAEMSAITERFGNEVAAIANAVHSGQLTTDQGQQITAEQYQSAQMQFEVLSAWHDMLAQDLARTETSKQRTGNREQGQD